MAEGRFEPVLHMRKGSEHPEERLPAYATEAEFDIVILAEAKRIVVREQFGDVVHLCAWLQSLADRIADRGLAKVAEKEEQ